MPSGKHQPGDGQYQGRHHSVTRREALRVLGSASALPLVYPSLSHHRYEAPAPLAWRPRFLAPDELETVAALSECVVPGTATSGTAWRAYIDDALEHAEPAFQTAFKDGLAWLDGYVARAAGAPFVELDRNDQHHLLAAISDTSRAHEPKGYAFLTQIKQLTIEGYYRS
ncbi:MAG: gluconate 2-dehydrogenase subunit 3 family protein [Acidobacteriota bacterium]|nr:gluconate 2-dehydrogenase subunit 3 family protein [Acidobacteriota bacterium]